MPAKRVARKSTDVETITIQPPKIEKIVIRIKSMSPLLMHAWSEKAIKQMEEKQQQRAKSGKQPRDPESEFENARYIINDEFDGIPVLCIKNCIVEAGVMAEIPKTHLRKALFVSPTHARKGEEDLSLIPIICPGGPVLKRDMVRIAMGTSTVRYRPLYNKWECDVPIEYNASMISTEQLVNLLDQAGYSVGLGEWRPQKNGIHGRFRVEQG